MKALFSKILKFQPIFNLVLIIMAGLIILLLIIGTIYSCVRPEDSSPLFIIGGAAEETDRASISHGINIYPGIGRLRIALSDSSTLVLGISFPYPADDTAFSEELYARVNEFRNIAIDYFSSLPPESLARLDEDAAKREIISQYNEILRLGSIDVLYFTDLAIFSSF